MSPIDPSVALGDLVTRDPALAPRFEALGLDYCCGGARSLAEACADTGLALDDVVRQLGESPAPAPEEWTAMGVPALVDHIEATHHVYLSEALPRMAALADRVLDVHGARHQELAEIARLVHELRAELVPHLSKEEQVLFPMIRRLYASQTVPTFHCGTLRNPIQMMEFEHDRAGELLARIRSLTSAHPMPSDGCASYHALHVGLTELEADTHLHIHKENNVLFPAVVAEEARRSGA
jgi:regulator of cell morphogenesis and NO signaling